MYKMIMGVSDCSCVPTMHSLLLLRPEVHPDKTLHLFNPIMGRIKFDTRLDEGSLVLTSLQALN